jgi:tRNA1Val (adenine37-N6)-methyltransferase
MSKPTFRFKQFVVQQDRCALKVGTDGVLFGAWVAYAGAKRILDIGTGTGLLALIAAQRNHEATIDAVEIDDPSAQQAAQNVADSPWADRIRVHRMDVRRMRSVDRFDLIICNPPYYEGYFTSQDQRVGLAKHSNELHLSELIAAVRELLTPDGRFNVIIPLNREEEFLKAVNGTKLAVTRRCVVRYVGHRPPKRLLLELDRSGKEMEDRELTIEASGPFDYTAEYRALITDLFPGF